MADPTEPPVVLNGSPPPPPLLPEPELSDAGDSDGVAELCGAGFGAAAGVTAAAVDFDFAVEVLEGLLSSVVVEDGGTSAVVGSAFLVGLGVGVTSTGVLLTVVGEGSLPM